MPKRDNMGIGTTKQDYCIGAFTSDVIRSRYAHCIVPWLVPIIYMMFISENSGLAGLLEHFHKRYVAIFSILLFLDKLSFRSFNF